MKYATYITLFIAFLLFGCAAYYHFIELDEILHQRFMGFGTLVLMFLVIPCFLLWRYFKRQKEKERNEEINNS